MDIFDFDRTCSAQPVHRRMSGYSDMRCRSCFAQLRLPVSKLTSVRHVAACAHCRASFPVSRSLDFSAFRRDGRKFEQFCIELVKEEGGEVTSESGVGPDAGVDFCFSAPLHLVPVAQRRMEWVAQAKLRTGTVEPRDVGISGSLEHCFVGAIQGYLLITNSNLRSTTARIFKDFNESPRNVGRYAYYWDENELLARVFRHPHLLHRFEVGMSLQVADESESDSGQAGLQTELVRIPGDGRRELPTERIRALEGMTSDGDVLIESRTGDRCDSTLTSDFEFRPQLRLERVKDDSVHEAVGSDFVIGRGEDCQIVIHSRDVSRQHCRIVARDSEWLVEELESKNGTYLNGEPLPRRHLTALANGDVLRIGSGEDLAFRISVRLR